jgi:hypothetical protein
MNLCSQGSLEDDEACENVRRSLENCQLDQDLIEYIENNKTGSGRPGIRPQVECVSQAKKTMSVIFPLKKHMSAIFCLLHDTK